MPTVSPFDRESLREIEARTTGASRPCAELVPWLFKFSDDVIVNKDSSVMVAYEYTGPDTDSVSINTVVEMLDHHIRSMAELARFPISIWWTTHRRHTKQYETMPMPDPVSQIIDDERQKAFHASGNYINRHYISLTLAPSVGVDRFMGRFSHSLNRDGLSVPKALVQALKATFSETYLFAYTRSEIEEVVATFERTLSGFVNANPHLTFTRLSGRALGGFMHACANPVTDDIERVTVPESPALDVDMCDNEMLPGDDYLYFYAKGRARVGIATGVPGVRRFWPRRASVRSLERLFKVNGELTVSHCFKLASQTRAMRFLNGIRRFHENRRVDMRGIASTVFAGRKEEDLRQNRSRIAAASEVHDEVGEVEMDYATYGDYNFTVISWSPVFELPMHPDERRAAEKAAYRRTSKIHEEVDGVLRSAQFMPVQETIHATSAFTVTIPGMWRECVRWAFIKTEELSRLLPLRGVSAGHIRNQHLTNETGRPCSALAAFMTEFGTPYWFLAYVLDVGHMLICGRTGFGKTIFMMLCAVLFRKYPNAELVGFDKDDSMRIPMTLMGGRYMRMGSAAGGEFQTNVNPYRLLKEARHLGFLVNWTVLLAKQRSGHQATQAERDDLESTLIAVRGLDEKRWRLSTIHASLKEGGLKRALAGWVNGAVDAHYFDHEDDAFDVDVDTQLVAAMAMDGVLKDPGVARPFITYVSYRIQDRIDRRREAGIIGPVVLLLPEIWNLLDDEQFANEIGDRIVTYRKKLGCIWMDAQSPEQVADSVIWPAIRDNVLVRVFVPVQKFTPATKKAYVNNFGLTDQQISVISKLIPKRDYLITEQTGASRRVSVELDPRSIAILRSESSAQIRFDRFQNSGDPDWRMAYIDAESALIESQRKSPEDGEEENQDEALHA
ncbi:VirB4 family type IV secretion system protein [Burkholderia cenocepacia]|uniref:VirB4 family type IV secretion system protein n=1 Tax=Burkholderia cenocepacia TaxID=95486 RepID=UPI002231EA6E|nr:conjugal transfer protein TraC [Burkholderia cenocepacia]MCW3677844.1 conjugal transfer protein TraC [Burkholderia cenocepacia]